jgi:sugar/nucleoside kinase (ribokinase family)
MLDQARVHLAQPNAEEVSRMGRVVRLGIHIVDALGRPVTAIPPGQNLALLEEIRLTVAGTAAGTSINFIVSTMQRYGIHTDGLVRKRGVQTSATLLPIRPTGERPALHVIGASAALKFDDVRLDIISQASFMHIGGTPLMKMFDGEPMGRVFRFAKEKGLTTTYDLLAIEKPNLVKLVEACLPFVDYFMPGFEEASMMTGLPNRKEVIRFFLERGAKHTVFKMSGRGSSVAWMENGVVKELRIPAFKATVVDSTGCGDAYCAGFIVGREAGRGFAEPPIVIAATDRRSAFDVLGMRKPQPVWVISPS